MIVGVCQILGLESISPRTLPEIQIASGRRGGPQQGTMEFVVIPKSDELNAPPNRKRG